MLRYSPVFAAETRLVTTILAIPAYRLKPTDESQFSFYEAPAEQPQALRWKIGQ